jgi:hypothetical protein
MGCCHLMGIDFVLPEEKVRETGCTTMWKHLTLMNSMLKMVKMANIEKNVVPGHPGQKVYEILSQWKKAGTVACPVIPVMARRIK